MIYSVRGNLILMDAGFAVVECGGVGYRVQTSITTQKQLKLNTETMLYTYMNVREDAMELYGFASKGELSTFKMLIGITGVGPKVALAILSELSSEQIAMCVSSGDSKTLTRASGVGPKLAQRIVLELKDKIKGIAESEGFEISKGSVVVDTGNVPKAVAALAVLGYSAADVTPILSKLDPNMSVEAMIAATLKQMA
ncbi:MAG: Holliday junction branch migration protein RuvA [Ruminococcus sp.]|uniref:Holliday junction branch migration protein RuvA n=1 Tax=Ruminococcus sp. TaxID=41978 RepID=UPI00292DD815|nr:Holliday junction branch migration protein RuvA [uncultured Ruminococcus sp.]MBQ1897958.1 Holliday junction branch migration protein RuvA [Ruminococcus sp.]MBQ4238077.1 Holliday junction branch migration protein RuvA [Ruminococcus sp.]